MSVEDYYDLAAIGLCKASKKFNNDRSKFTTFAYECMYTEVFQEIRVRKAKKRIPENQIVYYQAELYDGDNDTASFLNYISPETNMEDELLIQYSFEEYISRLSRKNRTICILLRSGYNLREIMEIVGCSRTHIYNIRKSLYEYLINLSN